VAGAFGVMKPPQIRGVVFDMDGVLVDSHPTHRSAWKQFLQSVGRKTSEEELDFILDGRKREEILRYFLGELSEEQLREYGNRKDEMLRRLGNGIHPIEGVVDFLTSLRSAAFKTAIATSAGTTRTKGTLADLGLRDCFDAVITGDDVKVGKPDPAIYRMAAERLGEDPRFLLAIEDASSGVKAAIGAGLRCIGIASDSRADSLRSAGAILVVPHFRSLSMEALSALPS
jgi:beta-phosphoglucomutase